LLLKKTEENARLQQQITGLEARLAENDKRFEQMQRQIDGTDSNLTDRSNRRK
jgi:BMFP domain-containing protein YqiC